MHQKPMILPSNLNWPWYCFWVCQHMGIITVEQIRKCICCLHCWFMIKLLFDPFNMKWHFSCRFTASIFDGMAATRAIGNVSVSSTGYAFVTAWFILICQDANVILYLQMPISIITTCVFRILLTLFSKHVKYSCLFIMIYSEQHITWFPYLP